MPLFASRALSMAARLVTQRQTFSEPKSTWKGVLPGGARSPTHQASAHFTPWGNTAQPSALCSMSPAQRGLPGPLLPPPISLSHCPLLALNVAHHHLALLSPQREHQLIPVPGTESGRWQALSKLLGLRMMSEASVSPSRKERSPLCGLQGLSHIYPPQGCLS